MIVNKGNVQKIEHDGNQTLTVEFMGNGLKYSYTPFSEKAFDDLVLAAADQDREVFKKHFNSNVKQNKALTFKKL